MVKQTKMNAELAKKVKELGINAKSEEEARTKLLDILTENGIEGMDDEDTDTLIEIAESFVEDAQAAAEEETEEAVEEQTEEEEAEQLAEEAAEEEDQPEAKETEEEVEEEEDGDEYDAMDRKALKSFIAEQGLEVKVTKSKSDEDLRDEVRNAMAEKEAAAKKATKKSSKKEEAKPAKKEEKKSSRSNRRVLVPNTNKDDRQFFNFLKKLFPDGEYEFAWVTGGVSVKYVGKNGRRNIMSAKNCSMQENGDIKCNVYLPTLCKKTEVLENANLEYKTCFSGDPFLNGVILQEVVETLKDLMPEMLGVVKKIDKKLGDNREKMEKELEKNKKPAKKEEKPAKKGKK